MAQPKAAQPSPPAVPLLDNKGDSEDSDLDSHPKKKKKERDEQKAKKKEKKEKRAAKRKRSPEPEARDMKDLPDKKDPDEEGDGLGPAQMSLDVMGW